MLYKIQDKYYVKVGNDFVEVRVVVDRMNKDVSLEPTKNKVENSNTIRYTIVSFEKLKEEKLRQPSKENKLSVEDEEN